MSVENELLSVKLYREAIYELESLEEFIMDSLRKNKIISINDLVKRFEIVGDRIELLGNHSLKHEEVCNDIRDYIEKLNN